MTDENLINQRWDAARQNLVDAANAAGVEAGVLVKIAGFESQFNPQARPVAGKKREELNTVTQFDGTKAMSSAYGYGQFLDATWVDMVRNHGEKYGVTNASVLPADEINSPEMRNNARLQAGMLAEFTRKNLETAASLGGADASANAYALHNLGGSDGQRFLRAMAADPDARVDSVLSSNVITRNSSLYGDGSISLSNAYQNMGAQMDRYASYASQVDGLSTQTHEPEPPQSQSTKSVSSGGLGDADARIMSEGMRGDDVRSLQVKLRSLGFKGVHDEPLKTDAMFGPSTKAAVQAYQAKSHLVVDGKAGPATLNHLEAQSARNSIDPASVNEAKILLDDPVHPGHEMYRQALRGMEIIDADQGRRSDMTTSKIAGAIAAESINQGLDRIDVVALSTDAIRCWAMQGQTNDPFKKLASVDIKEAVNTSLDQSSESFNAASRRHANQQVDQVQQTAREQPVTMHR